MSRNVVWRIDVINVMKRTAIALGVVAITASAQAGVVIDATDRGWYDHTGFHNPPHLNYVVGNSDFDTFRNWFVFDLSTIDVEIVALQLRAWNPADGFFSGHDETYVNYDVTTNLTDLMNGGVGGLAAYEDLGSGTVYASYDASNADNGTSIVIDLNAAAVADANAAHGGLWGIGGAITTLNGGDEYLFGFTGGNLADTQLVVTLIPGGDCPWDLDNDGNVGTGDLILLLGSWGDPYGTADLIELLGNWGPCR